MELQKRDSHSSLESEHYSADVYDDEVEPKQRYSSSEVIIAAQELKFRQKQAQEKAERFKGGKGEVEAESELRKAYVTLAHQMNRQQLEENYNVDLEAGLSSNEVQKRVEEHGLNQLTPPYKVPWWMRLLKDIFAGFFNILLWVGSVLCFISYAVDPSAHPDPQSLYLGVVIALIVLITGLFIYHQETVAANLMEGLGKMMPADVMVIRDKQKSGVQPNLLVPGDIVEIHSGMLVPADIRIIECSEDTEVDNSSLTGESEPQKRDWRKSDKIPAESPNLIFFGTLLLRGKGKGIVIATGDSTFMGRTAQLAVSTSKVETPIARELSNFVIKISIIAFLIAVVFFIIGMIKTGNVIKNLIFLIGIIVANVPEGLLATLTVCLTLTARKMYTNNVQVKSLESVETLGSTSVICSDKTGTLTTNVMTVQHVYFDLKPRDCDTRTPLDAVNGDFYDQSKNRKSCFMRLVRCSTLCNNANFLKDGTVDPTSNATEAAMVKFANGHISAEYGMSINSYRNQHKRVFEIPFNSTNKWQISVHKLLPDFGIENESKVDPNTIQPLVVLKGAPERVLDLCDRYLFEGEEKELTDDIRKKIMDDMQSFGEKGERVLACADLVLDSQRYDLSRPEPKIEKFSDRKNENRDIIYVVYNNKEYPIEIPEQINKKTNQKFSFSQSHVHNLMKEIEQNLKIPIPNQRILFGGQILDSEQTFKDAGIQQGSVVKLCEGSYTFYGTNRNDANFPLRRSGEQGLIFLGFMTLTDPPRPGVREAVLKCQTAGIKVIMVTGDHPITAKAIARKVCIIGEKDKTIDDIAKEKYNGDVSQVPDDSYNAIVVPGSELQDALDKSPPEVEAFWNRVLNKDMVVFARTSPQQKLLIVSACQERGGIVAVTGDGVNDSPALKKADIGIAMGKTGTEVAKESAHMILLDDNFASIVKGIEQGRIVFDNLKKSIAYALAANIPEVVPFLIYSVIGVPLPLTTIMMLLICVGTDIAPAISVAYEGKEADIMKRRPRNPNSDHLVTWKLISFSYLQTGILQSIGGFFAYFVVLYSFGFSWPYLIGLDNDGVFASTNNNQVPSNAYYLYCFKGSYVPSHDCYYYPNFATMTSTDYSGWLSSKKNYAKKARSFVKTKFNQDFSDNLSDTQTFWQSTVMPTWENELYTSNGNYLNRMCWKSDYCTDSRTPDYPSGYSFFPMSSKDRTEILSRAQTAFFAAIVIMQWGDLLICKTRLRSLFEQGMWNTFMNYALLWETLLIAFLVYIPFANTIFGTRPLRFVWWTAGLPFTLLIFIIAELRKGWIRKYRHGYLERVTFW